MSDFRAKCIKEFDVGEVEAEIKLTPWIYGDLVIHDGFPIIVDNDGEGKLALLAERYTDKRWAAINLTDMRQKFKQE